MSARRVTAALDPCSNLVKHGLQAYSESTQSPTTSLGSRSQILTQNGRKSGQRDKHVMDVNKYISVAVQPPPKYAL